jgi:hypothetical protein
MCPSVRSVRHHFELITQALMIWIVLVRVDQWGGLQLDKDVRILMNYFSGLCQRTIRDKFSRLVQICSVIQLEKVHLLHCCNFIHS